MRKRARTIVLGIVLALGSLLILHSTMATRIPTLYQAVEGVGAGSAAGRHRNAVAVAEGISEDTDPSEHGVAWRQEDAARLARTRAHLAALPESCRQAVAEADRADGTIRALISQGSYRQAHALALRQLETRERLLGEDHERTAASIATLAEVLLLRGDRGEAIRLRKRALAQRTRILGQRHPLVAESLAALGRSEKGFVHVARAESLFTAALDLRRDLFGTESLEAAESLLDLGDFYRSRTRFGLALDLLGQSLRIRQALLPAGSPEITESLCTIGLVHLQSGHWERAEPFLRSADRNVDSRPDTPIEIRVLTKSLVSDVLERRGDFPAAEQRIAESIRLYEAIFREGLPGYPPSRGLGDWTKLAMLQIRQGKGESAWASVERGLSRSLLDELYPPDSSAVPDGSEGGLAERSRFCSLPEIQRTLAPDAALVGWLEASRTSNDIVDFPYWGYVIRASGPVHWVEIDAPPDMPAEAGSTSMLRYTLTVRAAAEWPLQAPMAPELLQLASAAYAERVRPLMRYLNGVNRLYIVKAGSTRRAPLDALIDSTGVYLGDRFEISYVLSATMLCRTQRAPEDRRHAATWEVLLVGNGPDGTQRSTRPAPSATASEGEGLALPLLPGAQDEIRQIAPLFGHARLLPDDGEPQLELQRLAALDSLRQFRLIHIAMHAEVPGNDPMESVLIFPPPARAPMNRDGTAKAPVTRILRPREILSGWHLDADLVTLSACKTGTATWSYCEPIGGLCQAFMLTGAKSLLVALWSVDDRSTALLMERFYQNLTGSYADLRAGSTGVSMSRPRALQEAKRWLREYRDADGSRPFESPARWASFVLLGDPGIEPTTSSRVISRVTSGS